MTPRQLLWVSIAVALLRHVQWHLLPLPCNLPLGIVDVDRQPNPQPLTGVYAPNTLLRDAGERMFEGAFWGSESVEVSPNGTLWMLDRYGNAFTAALPTPGAAPPPPTPAHYVGPGRPLGYRFDASGRLVICDSLKGLMRLDPTTGALTVLANRATPDSPLQPASPIHYANDLDIAKDGSIYFSDSGGIPPALNRAGFYDTMASYLLTVMQGEPLGRLLVHRPESGTTHVLVPRLWFANGVALAEDESFVLVVETCGMRVHKHWLQGPAAGTTEVLVDGLPGFPDGLTRASDGNFWLAVVAPDSPVRTVAQLGGRHARWALAWLLQVASAPVKRWGMVVKLSPRGEVLLTLMDPDGSNISGVSGVAEHGQKLLMGHLGGNYVSMVDLRQLALPAA